MRIKSGKIELSAIHIGTNLLCIISGEAFFRGYPSPIWAEWIMLAGGVAIPGLEWSLRSASQAVCTTGIWVSSASAGGIMT